MPLRGGPPPELGLGQLGGIGGAQSPQAPGLLQMAQAAMGDGGDARGGGGGGGGVHGLYGSAPVSPEDAKYFDAFGGWKLEDPEQTAAASGINLGQLAGGFLPRQIGHDQGYSIPSDKGGFFNAEDLYRKLGRDIPRISTFGQAGPSTNNWRLLGMGPGWIMRNGSLINTNAAQAGGPDSWSGSGGISAEHYVAGRGSTPLGAGQGYGVPNMIQIGAGHGTSWGWPGADYWNSTSQY